MTLEEKELMEEKFAGVRAMLEAKSDIDSLQHAEIHKILSDVLQHVKLTNGRVTKLEGCFFAWFNTPLRVALFFGLVIFVDFIFRNASTYGFIKKIFDLI